jgi:hypothetical protein
MAVVTLGHEPLDLGALQVRVGRGKFETVASPLMLIHECLAPFGLEVESRYTPRPVFAGGTDPRKHLCMQLEVPSEVASALHELDEAVAGASFAPGDWAPLVTERDGRFTLKARVVVEGPRPATFRVGDGQVLEAAWSALSCALDAHGGFRERGPAPCLHLGGLWAPLPLRHRRAVRGPPTRARARRLLRVSRVPLEEGLP